MTIDGTSSLLLGEQMPLRAALAGTGILVTLVAVIGVWRQDRTLRALIEQIQKGNP